MDDAELARAVQRWRRAEGEEESTLAAAALARGLQRRGSPTEGFAAALASWGEPPGPRTVERLAYLAGLGLGDPRLESPEAPRGIACGPPPAPVLVAVGDGRLMRVGPDGLLVPVALPPAASRRVEWVGLDYDAAGDLWWLVRPRRERGTIRRFRLVGGREPAEEIEALRVASTGRRPLLVVGVSREPAVLVERDNRQIWLQATSGATRLPVVEPYRPNLVAGGPGPGLLALVLWGSQGGPGLRACVLDPEGAVVADIALGGIPQIFQWQPDGSLQIVGHDTEPSLVWTRAGGTRERPWMVEGPSLDEDRVRRIWRAPGGTLWDCASSGVRCWPDADAPGYPAEATPAGPWRELDGLLLDAPRNRLLGWGYAGEVAAWDLATGERRFLLRERDELSVTVLGDGRVVLVGRAGVRVYPGDGRGIPTRLSPEGMEPVGAAPGPAPDQVLLWGRRREVLGALVWRVSLDGGAVLGEVEGPVGAATARAAGFLDAGRTLWVAWEREGGSELGLHDAASGAMMARHELGLRLVDRRMFVPHPDGVGLVLPAEGGPAVLERGGPPSPLLPPDTARGFGLPVGFSPCGGHLAWYGPEGLEVRDLARGTRRRPAESLEDLSQPVVLVAEDRLARAEGRRVRFLPLVPSRAER